MKINIFIYSYTYLRLVFKEMSSSNEDLITFLRMVNNTECSALIIFLNYLKIFLDGSNKLTEEIFNLNDFEKSFKALKDIYNEPDFANNFFSHLFFMARKELTHNISRYDKNLSTNIKDSLKKIIMINVSRLYDILNVRLFDKQIDIIYKNAIVQCCNKAKTFLTNMMEKCIMLREHCCFGINQRNEIRNLEQKKLENIITANLSQEETQKKRKNEETENSEKYNKGTIKRITINVFRNSTPPSSV